MAKREKTSVATYRSLRINPATSQEDADMLEIIERLESKGFTFKQIAQDAILRANGNTPEMYDKASSGFLLTSLEDMLSRFAGEIMSNVRGGKHSSSVEDAENTDAVSPFAKQFAKSFMQRQQKKGDE